MSGFPEKETTKAKLLPSGDHTGALLVIPKALIDSLSPEIKSCMNISAKPFSKDT